MNNKLVCKVLVLGTLACGLQSMAFANEVSDTNVGNGGANSQKTYKSNWLDRTDIGISWEAGNIMLPMKNGVMYLAKILKRE